MQEAFVSFIWKFQLFKTNNLQTSNNERLEIIRQGQENENTGPDYFNAQVRIDNQKWAGTVEIHVKASDWYVHGHENDSNYDNVVLHVVWENDLLIYRKNNSIIPTLELKHRIENEVIKNYKKLFSNRITWINCEDRIAFVDSFTTDNWLERLYIERLDKKTIEILAIVNQSNNDWELVLYKLLLKNFGLMVNRDAFIALSNVLDYAVIRKEWHSQEHLEALLLGSVGLLNGHIEEAYFIKLREQYSYLTKKYRLKQSTMKVNFFRLRPANFPTIRLAQFANLYYHNKSLFSTLIYTHDLHSIYKVMAVSASKFWTTHYTFEIVSKKSQKKLSKAFIDLLLINAIIPLKFVYQNYIGDPDNEVIIEMMRTLKSEKNSIVKKFSSLKIQSDSALISQALLQLKNEYCDKNHCLKCAIGNSILANN